MVSLAVFLTDRMMSPYVAGVLDAEDERGSGVVCSFRNGSARSRPDVGSKMPLVARRVSFGGTEMVGSSSSSTGVARLNLEEAPKEE